VLVTVLHFDELFHAGHGRSRRYFAISDQKEIARRVDAFFRRIERVRRILKLEPFTFVQLPQILRQNGASGDAIPA
jgi:hypothetical protein